jgi:transcriptional regulator with XRE-family HTH domain
MPLVSVMSTQTAFSEFRKNSGLTLDAVADLFKVDRTTILRWEKGEPPVPVKRLSEIEAMTGISRPDLRPDVFRAQEAGE